MSLSNHFFVIGAQKAGTTSLHRYLATHPDIFGSPTKETNHFCKPTVSPKRPQSYESYFEHRNGERWAFEASVHYTQFPKYIGVPERIFSSFPDARLIYIIRHPVERVYSHYMFRMTSASGREHQSFEDAVRTNPVYVETSSYYMQIAQYLEFFPTSRIHVLLFEDLVRDPRSTLRKIFDFLEVDSSFEPPNITKAYNETKHRRTMVAPTVLRMKQAAWYRRLPRPVQLWIRRRFRVEALTKKDIFTPRSYNLVHAMLQDDVAKLQEYLGRELPWDFPKSKYA